MHSYFFHLMPYPHLPADFQEGHPSAWVTLSNEIYDPEEGRRLYNRYLDELEYADQLGFYGVCVNEHHQTAYGTMPSPNLMGAALARRTTQAKIALLGNAIALRDNPIRVAEEVAMLDVITGGRIISGFVRGIGSEYHSLTMNPTYSRERFIEAHDLIIRAWQEKGPFSHDGKHYTFRHVNIFPRPYQKPHPPIFLPTQGSGETIRWAADPVRKYVLLQTFNTYKSVKQNFDDYRAAARDFGYEADPMQLGWAMPIYVAETDEQAQEEAGAHAETLFNDLLKNPYMFPPGYLTEASMEKVFAHKASLGARRPFAEMLASGLVLVGSPKTVAEKLQAYYEDLRFGHLVAMLHFAGMNHEQTKRCLELFATKVMPHIKGLGER